MANEQNLIPNSERTESERRAIAASGGRASGEARRRKKLMREAFDELLSRDYTDKESGTVMDGTTVLATKVFQQAIRGDLKAFEIIRDTTGQKPVERVETVEISQETYERVARALEE